MVRLFLSEPKWDKAHKSGVIDRVTPLLNELGSLIRSLVAHGGRSEARLWLCSTLSGASMARKQQRKIFMSLLRSKPRKMQLVSRLLQMIIEKKPRKLGAVLAKRSHILEKFFQGNPKRILRWFSDFATDGGSDHKRGAKGLAQFAFTNRDICWEELEWRGKHGQSPAVVATKPHYLLDLNVQKTVENFLDNVPEFWSSNEFAETLRDGQILFLDTDFFLDLFVRFMYEEDVEDVWHAVDDFLMEESFSSLTQHLLITLEEGGLCHFLELLQEYVDPTLEPLDFDDSSFWVRVVLAEYGGRESIDEVLLLNCVINQGRQLLRLVRDENINDDQDRMKEIVTDICRVLDNTGSFSLALKEFSEMKSIEAIKLLGLLSWIVHFRLSDECQTPDSWESLFRENGIEFRRSSDHSMVSPNGFSGETESDSDDKSRGAKTRHKKEKSKRRKKKRRTDDLDLSDDELLLGLHQRSRSWLLSTDEFSTTWTNVDLPGYISRYCLCRWIKWLAARQQ
ncbi:PREDICTED: uncharacterized protein LOC104822459 [Tarenaya hassleriana]|uniref:uncharacterized protein LOC104822459 n=1 Tax=Tarenaya hassleriana TaxID=28532 RepID=UPI00053C6C71|nr:PREDICTED: uncharacterized protein LOC104822459 [Tarenaya hassleriana]